MWCSIKPSVLIGLTLIILNEFHHNIYAKEIRCNQTVDAIILIDGSDSISDNDWGKSRNFARGLIDSFNIGMDTMHVGMMVYSSGIGDVVDLQQFRSKETLKTLASGLRHPKDGTNTANGIREMTKMMEREARPGAARVAVILTDGRSRYPNETIEEAQKAKSAGIVMITVGVGHAISRDELAQIATSEREVIDVSDFSSLQGVVGILEKLLCKVIITTTTMSTSTVRHKTTPRTRREILNQEKAPEKKVDLESLCKGCMIDRGIGYSAHPTDCGKYIQCFLENGRYRAKVMPCAFGTYWDSDKIACGHSYEVNCTTDLCLETQRNSSYPMKDNCAAYWSCRYGRAEAKCCPKKHRYVEGSGCQPDDSCEEICPDNETVKKISEISECDLLTDENNPNAYIQIVPGFGPISRPCAPGSAFDKNQCSCAIISSSWEVKEECKPSVSYDFQRGFVDLSDNNVYAGFEKVRMTQNGTALFAQGSSINIWRFANVEFGKKLFVRLRFLKSDQGPAEQTIVTNCYGIHGEGPSIAIKTAANMIVIAIKSKLGKSGTLLFLQADGFNDVTMVYDGQHLTGKVNEDTKSIAVTGNIERRQAGLILGDCDGLHSFHGQIQYFLLYMCLPDGNTSQTNVRNQRNAIA
ncbi:protein PIF-like [Argonauta hians]